MPNKNDTPLNNINGSFPLDNFKFKEHFIKIATIMPDASIEALLVKNIIDERYTKETSLVYLFVIDGNVVKVGSTTTTMKDRISSYNCGKKAYRKSGTCSTTNYLVLQSFLLIGKDIDIFAYYTGKIKTSIFGIENYISVPAKDHEKIINTELKKIGEFPILCTQK